MDALRVGYAWESQENVPPTIPKTRKGGAAPSRSLRVFSKTDRGVGRLHERAWQRRRSCDCLERGFNQQLPPPPTTLVTMQKPSATTKQHVETLAYTHSMLLALFVCVVDPWRPRNRCGSEPSACLRRGEAHPCSHKGIRASHLMVSTRRGIYKCMCILLQLTCHSKYHH